MSGRRFAVLAVCTANICRSPVMELLLRDRLASARFEVGSAGVNGLDAQPMDAMSEMELLRFGVSAGSFRSQALTGHLVRSADLVLTATVDHRRRLLEDEPRAMRTSFTLREFAQLCVLVDDGLTAAEVVADAARRRQGLTGSFDVKDPYRRSPKVHRETADQISEAVGTIAERLNRCPAA